MIYEIFLKIIASLGIWGWVAILLTGLLTASQVEVHVLKGEVANQEVTISQQLVDIKKYQDSIDTQNKAVDAAKQTAVDVQNKLNLAQKTNIKLKSDYDSWRNVVGNQRMGTCDDEIKFVKNTNVEAAKRWN